MPFDDRTTSIFTKRKSVLLLLLLFAAGLTIGSCFWPWTKPEALLRRALVTRNSEDRIRYLQRAIAARGNYPEAETQLCLAFARLKDWDKVGTTFAKINKSDCPPRDLVALTKLCLESEQWKSAEVVLETLKDKAVPAEERLLLSCALYRGTGRHLELIDAAEQLTKVASNDPRYWWLLAQIHEQLENPAEAIRVYDAALSHNLPPLEKGAMRHRLIEHCIEVGDASLARKQLEILRSLGEQGPRMDVYEARLSHLEGDPERALWHLEAALRELGETPEALRLRGILHLELGQLEHAATDLKQVTELTPHDEIALFKLAETYRRLGQGELGQQYQKLARTYHQRYLINHKTRMRIKELTRQLNQTPTAEARDELLKLKAELPESK